MQEKALDETHVGYVSGETLAGWQAYNITSDPHAGVGSWTPAQLTQYLHSGNVPDVAQAGGPMGEAVEHSFSKLSDADLSAMVTYMHSVPAVNKGSTKSRYAWGVPNRDDVAVRGEPFPTKFDPESLYLGACASCHQANGLGTSDHYYPSLVHNTTVGAMNPNNLVQVILHGLKRNTSATDNVGMPAFADEMSDAEIASLTNYLTKQFGNPDAIVVSERDVQKLRASN
jgi:cytochrome c553